MTADQLNLLGEPDRPEDLELGLVQREAMRALRDRGVLHRDEAGQIAHHHRRKHDVDELCAYCATDGALLLESLIRRRLVEPAPNGAVQLPRGAPPARVDDVWDGTGNPPYGVIPF